MNGKDVLGEHKPKGNWVEIFILNQIEFKAKIIKWSKGSI